MNEGENAVVSSMKVSRCYISLCPRVTEGIGDAAGTTICNPGAVIQPADDTFFFFFVHFS